VLNSSDVFTNWSIGSNLARAFVNVKGLDGQELEVTTAGSSLSFSAGRTQRGISFSLNSGSTYTISLIVKRTSTHSIFGYYLLATNNLGAGFNVDTLTTGQIYENAVFGSRVRRITPLGNDDFLCEETFTMTDNRTATLFYVAPVVGTTDPANPSVGSRIAFAAPQIELGAVATSRILTGNSIASRAADVCSKTGLADYIGQTTGTIFAEINTRLTAGANGKRIISLSDGTVNNRIELLKGATDTIEALVTAASVQQANIATATNRQGNFKIALAYAPNDIVLYVNGAQVGVDALATIPACNTLHFGCSTEGRHFNDLIGPTAILKQRLTNQELATLTTL
jgi:hypothetical protein